MTYLPADLAPIAMDPLTEPYWAGCKIGKLVLQRCADCGTFRHPPAPICSACRSMRAEWTERSGRGTVYTYTLIHHPVHPKLMEHVPYNVVLVTLEDAPGVRIVSNLVDVAPQDVRIGLSVEVIFEETASDTRVPRFRVTA
jgi:uncharacterized OB-fold protein